MYRQYGWTWDSSQKRDTWQVCNFFSTLISFSLEHFHCLFKIWTFASKFAYCYGHPKLIFTVTLRILTVKKHPQTKLKYTKKYIKIPNKTTISWKYKRPSLVFKKISWFFKMNSCWWCFRFILLIFINLASPLGRSSSCLVIFSLLQV